MMTVATIIVGLLPIMHGTGTGSEVIRRIAAPMVGGIVSATLLTLVVIPAVYLIWKRAAIVRENRRRALGNPSPFSLELHSIQATQTTQAIRSEFMKKSYPRGFDLCSALAVSPWRRNPMITAPRPRPRTSPPPARSKCGCDQGQAGHRPRSDPGVELAAHGDGLPVGRQRP